MKKKIIIIIRKNKKDLSLPVAHASSVLEASGSRLASTSITHLINIVGNVDELTKN